MHNCLYNRSYIQQLIHNNTKMIKTNTKGYQKHPLSSSWHNTHRMTSNRLSFFGKGITCIDRLDNVPMHTLSTIKQLDLSHNAISKLDNIRQFCNLEVLNLAHNHIIDGKQIGKLGKMGKIRVLMVKGNPFIKSGQNKIQAFKVLLPLQTDIQLVSQSTQQLLSRTITKYCWKSIKAQYLQHIKLQIQLITQYNYQSDGKNSINRIIDTIAQEKVNDVVEECRKEVVVKIMQKGKQEEGNGNGYGESVGQFQEWVTKCTMEYEEGIERDIEDIDRQIQSQEEIYNHVKMMRKEKSNSKQKDTPISVLKRISKPILSRIENLQSMPRIPLQRSPQHRQPSLPNQNHPSHPTPAPHLHPPFPTHLQQKFESQYTTMLTKYNPVYQLLYSPLHSLKSKQKDLLIQTLSVHLKQRSFAAFKAQKYKEQYMELSKKYYDKDDQIKECQKKIVELKIGMGQIIDNLEREVQDRDMFVGNLKGRLDQMGSQKMLMAKRIQYLQQQLSEAKLKIIKQNNIIQKHKTDQQYQQLIKSRRQQTIKKQHLFVLCQKASTLYTFRQNQHRYRQQQNTNLLHTYFSSLNKQRMMTKLQKQVTTLICLNRYKQFVGNCQFEKSVKKLETYVRKGHEQVFMKILMRMYCYRKDVRARLDKFKQWKVKSSKNGCFKQWKSQMQNKKYINDMEKANVFFKQLIKKRSFKNWIIYMKMPIYLQAQLSVDLKTARIKHFLSLLHKNSIQNSLIHQKFLNLIMFINKNSRITNFAKLKHNCSIKSQFRSLKYKKLLFNLKINYFYEFVRLTNKTKYVRQVAINKEMELAKLRKRQILYRFHSEDNVRRVRVGKFRRIAEVYRKYSIGQSLRESLRQFMIEDKRNKNDIKTFIQLLQLNHINKLKINNKSDKLKLFTSIKTTLNLQNQARKKWFLSALMKPLQEKKKMQQFFSKKFYRLMLKYFNQWKIQSLKQKVKFLKNRIHQFGPQIQEISKRQKSVFQQKLVLMNIIDNKEKTIKGFVKQLQQAEYTIKTKEEKYQKLKQFLHDAGEDITVLGSKIQPSILAPQRDFDTFLDQERADYFNSFRKF